MNRSWLLAVPLLVLSKGVSAGVSPMTVSGSSALGAGLTGRRTVADDPIRAPNRNHGATTKW